MPKPKKNEPPPFHLDSTTRLLKLAPLVDKWKTEIEQFYGEALLKLHAFDYGLDYHLGQNVRAKRRAHLTALLRTTTPETPTGWQVVWIRNEGDSVVMFIKRSIGE